MSMENSSEEVLIATQKKEENESQNLSVYSDGEIIDDDEEDVKQSPIAIASKKLQKNFRARHSDHSDDESDNEDGLTSFHKKSGI